MIRSIKQKSLRQYYELSKTTDENGIWTYREPKLTNALSMLDCVTCIEDISPVYRVQRYKSRSKKELWTISVDRDPRVKTDMKVIFSLENGEVDILEYKDFFVKRS